MRLFLHVLLMAAALGSPDPLSRARAATWLEDFCTDPAARGWTTHGDPDLFTWDPARERLAATWDSTRTNTFFHRPLGTILTRAESFRFSFSLQLDELRTPDPDSTFQIALGLIHTSTAFRTNLFRGSGIHPVTGPFDLMEFNYFPGSHSISPTFSAVAIGTNNLRWSMVNLFPLELTPGNRFDVTLRFDATAASLHLDVLRDGQPWASGLVHLDPRFTDFRLDALSVTSYSGAGQPAGYGGNVFARGWVDDIAAEFPDPPAPTLALLRGTDGITLTSGILPGWTPRLEYAGPGGPWLTAEATPETLDGTWRFPDRDAPVEARFYRLRLDRP